MKIFRTILLASAATLLACAVASAQPKALGARITYGAELSYQHYLGNNFLELDLGWDNTYVGPGSLVSLVGIYDFTIVNNNGFEFYAGPGALLTTYSPQDVRFGFGIVGQIGIGYTFSFPLQLTLDWRPGWLIVNDGGFRWTGAALGVRYAF